MKTLFVSIGSTSTIALATLIERLIDLDIYKSDNTFKDMFVAIDTDAGALKRFNSFNDGAVAHTHTIGFKHSAGDVPSHNFLRASFRSDWIKPDMEIRAADRGVGGQRVKSFSTLEWKQQLDEKIAEFYNDVDDPDKECQVVLVASTWGGTATGMFQNVADFIAARIFLACQNKEHSHTQAPSSLTSFYIVLAMPDFIAAQGVFRNGNGYPGMDNFVYMMRGIQQAGWRGVLGKESEKDGAPHFVFPEFCDFQPDGDRWLPVDRNIERMCGAANSPLPAKAVVVIPTLLPGATSSTIAEELLLLVYMGILDRKITGFGNDANGKFIDIHNSNQNQMVIGINMVECQLDYDSEIRKEVARRLFDGWKKFTEDAGGDNNAGQFVRNFLNYLVKKPAEIDPDNDRLNRTVLGLLNKGLTSQDPKDIDELKKSIDRFMEGCVNDRYTFKKFDRDLFRAMKEYADGLDDDDLYRKAFEDSLVLNDVQSEYRKKIREWLNAVEPDCKKKVDKIKRMIDRAAVIYQGHKKGSRRHNWIVKFCNGDVAVSEEFFSIARKEIEDELRDLEKVMLVKATIEHFQLDSANSFDNWESVTTLLTEKRNEADKDDDAAGGRHGFIRKVADPRLAALLQNPKHIRIKNKDIIALMEKSNDTVALNTAYNAACDRFVKAVKAAINATAHAGDFSMITLANAQNVHCCSPVYQVSTTQSAIPSSMFHFYTKCKGAGDITWNDCAALGLGSFKRCKIGSVSDDNEVNAGGFCDPLPGLGVLTNDDVKYDQNQKPLYGMWLGTVDLGMTFGQVLEKSYSSKQLTAIQDNAASSEENGSSSKVKCLQTLFEKIAIGAMLGILDDKLRAQEAEEGKTLSISIRIADGLEWSVSSRVKDVKNLGLERNNNKCCFLQEIDAAFIKEVMGWMRRDANTGSCRFADALGDGVVKLFKDLMEQDRCVLQNISLAPSDEQRDLIRNLYESLLSRVTVSCE